MDELTSIRAFLQVVENGSFSAAARHRNMRVSSVARQVNALEDALGVRLLNRTTRHHSLTEAGTIYYEQAREIVREIDNLRHEVASYQESVKGTLRVQLRTSVGTEVILPAVPGFLEAHPHLALDVSLSDERVDLVENGIDVAVWLGNLEDSSMIARRLSPSRRLACASHAYFTRHGEPAYPTDLLAHNCLVYNPRNYGNIWRFRKDGETIEVTVSGSLQTESSSVLMAATLNGLGIMVAQEWMVRAAIADGRLRCVLPDYDVTPTDFDAALYVVFPHSRRLSPKTRAFVDFLVDLFRDNAAGRACGGSA